MQALRVVTARVHVIEGGHARVYVTEDGHCQCVFH